MGLKCSKTKSADNLLGADMNLVDKKGKKNQTFKAHTTKDVNRIAYGISAKDGNFMLVEPKKKYRKIKSANTRKESL